MFKGLKEGALGIGLKSFLNERFGEYGEIEDVEVDTKANKLRMRARLKGETASISAAIERYEIEREGDETYVVVKGISSSRQWMTLLLNKLFAGKRYKIPSALSRLL